MAGKENKHKRQRSANFSMAEVRILADTVSKFKETVENKKTDAVSNKEKESAWEAIAKHFNASSGTLARTASTLKLKYEGVKKELKKKVAANRQEYYKTGGGGGLQIPYADYELKILGMCSQIEGLQNRNGCDKIEEPLVISPRPLLDETAEEKYLNDIIEVSLSPRPLSKNSEGKEAFDEVAASEIIETKILENNAGKEAFDEVAASEITEMKIVIPSITVDGETNLGKRVAWNPQSLRAPLSSALKINKNAKNQCQHQHRHPSNRLQPHVLN